MQRTHLITTIFLLTFAALFGWARAEFLPFNFEFWVGLVLLPLVAKPTGAGPSLRFLLPAVGLLAATLLWYPSNTLLWFGAVFTGLLLWESRHGRLNWLPLAVLVVISPTFFHFTNVWTFELRLQLTQLAAGALAGLGMDVAHTGNQLTLHGQPFVVDEVCAGLKMLSTSLLLAWMVAAHFEWRRGRFVRWWGVVSTGVVAFVLALLANLNRILLLVLFNVPAEDAWHEGLGIASMVFFVMLPVYAVYRLLPNGFFADLRTDATAVLARPWYLLPVVLTALACWQQSTTAPVDNALRELPPPAAYAHLPFTTDANGVLRYRTDSALVLLKPPVRAFQGTHDPRYCWRGTGYEFTTLKRREVHGRTLYLADMSKDNTQLKTAWWLDNGTVRTVDETDWRWRSARGEAPFWLVNVTAATEAELLAVVEQL